MELGQDGLDGELEDGQVHVLADLGHRVQFLQYCRFLAQYSVFQVEQVDLSFLCECTEPLESVCVAGR